MLASIGPENAQMNTKFSPIFLEPLILPALRARKIKGSRKIGEGGEEGRLSHPSSPQKLQVTLFVILKYNW